MTDPTPGVLRAAIYRLNHLARFAQDRYKTVPPCEAAAEMDEIVGRLNDLADRMRVQEVEVSDPYDVETMRECYHWTKRFVAYLLDEPQPVEAEVAEEDRYAPPGFEGTPALILAKLGTSPWETAVFAEEEDGYQQAMAAALSPHEQCVVSFDGLSEGVQQIWAECGFPPAGVRADVSRHCTYRKSPQGERMACWAVNLWDPEKRQVQWRLVPHHVVVAAFG